MSRPSRIISCALAFTAVLAWGTSAHAATNPCSGIDEQEIGRILGPTTQPTDATLEAQPACRIALPPDLTLWVVPTNGGTHEFNHRRAAFADNSVEKIDDYVNGAFFGWGTQGALDFVARRGDQTATMRLTGTSSQLDFDASDPLASAPARAPSGSLAGSGLWVLMTDYFNATGDASQRPPADDVSGLWRTTDITPCAPRSNLPVRVSTLEVTGETLHATKLAGDSCLDDGAADFEGRIVGGSGTGNAFGRFGTAAATQGVPYDLTVVSPILVRLTGQAGSLRYTREYTRLSWPGIAGSEPGKASTLLGIPSPTQAITTKNVMLSGLLALLLFALVSFPTTLFNSTLEANLDHYRTVVGRLRRRRDRPRPPRHTRVWNSRPGVALYIALSGLLYSAMQPGWGLDMATLITFVGFTGALYLLNLLAVSATRLYTARRYRESGGHALVEVSTLGISVLCVLGSRAVGFIPGYLYGVLVLWEPQRHLDERDNARIGILAGVLTLVAAIVTWLLIPATQHLAGSTSNSLRAVPLGIDGGIFVGAVETLTIGLIPLRFLPGAAIRAYNRAVWLVLWCAGGFLFSLVLLRPGLVSGRSKNIVGTLVLATGAESGRGRALGVPPRPRRQARERVRRDTGAADHRGPLTGNRCASRRSGIDRRHSRDRPMPVRNRAGPRRICRSAHSQNERGSSMMHCRQGLPSCSVMLREREGRCRAPMRSAMFSERRGPDSPQGGRSGTRSSWSSWARSAPR